MKVLTFCFFNLVLVSFTSFSQNIYSTCYFGTAGLDFRTQPPTAITSSAMISSESPASICDTMGNILFYTNGGKSPGNPSITGGVWNSSNQLLANGILEDSGGCISSYYGAVAFPMPNGPLKSNQGLYYLFTRGCLESTFMAPNYNAGLTYSVIDMAANGGNGEIIEKNTVVVPYSVLTSHATAHEPLAAVKHANEIDFWIYSYKNDSIYSVLATANGVGNYQSYNTAKGKITISPRRDRLVAGSKLFELDASTGNLQFIQLLDTINAVFSPNGRFLYLYNDGEISQYDLDATNFNASKIIIATIPHTNYHFVLAPNFRIYLFLTEATSLPGVIECPNNAGLYCGFIMTPVSLNGKNSKHAFTNIPANYLFDNNSQACFASVSSMESEATILMYPNPAKEKITFEWETDELFDVTLYSSDLKIVYSAMQVNKKVEIEVSTLCNGIYIAQLKSSGKVYTEKIIIDK